MSAQPWTASDAQQRAREIDASIRDGRTAFPIEDARDAAATRFPGRMSNLIVALVRLLTVAGSWASAVRDYFAVEDASSVSDVCAACGSACALVNPESYPCGGRPVVGQCTVSSTIVLVDGDRCVESPYHAVVRKRPATDAELLQFSWEATKRHVEQIGKGASLSAVQ